MTPGIYEAAEALRRFVLSHGLPRTDMALVGLRCPYCGKSDRIRPLEHPGEIAGRLPEGEDGRYGDLYRRLAPQAGCLGVCKFCDNPVRLEDGQGPEPLTEIF